MHRTMIATALMIFVTAMVLGCGGAQQQIGSGKLRVVATTGMIGDAVKNVGGDHIELSVLMGPGVDPHLYKATKGDIDRLNEADIVFYNGLNLEAKMAEVFGKMANAKTMVAIGDGLPREVLRIADTGSGHPDPHIWFDVSLWRDAVDTVAKVLAAADSANSQFYFTQATQYALALTDLNQWVAEEIGSIPEPQRVLVTAHDAFEYFGRAYGMRVMGLQGISTVTEAGLYDVTQMIDFLVNNGIRAVFVESSVPRKSIEAVVEGCRSRGQEVVIGGTLFSDAMGEEGTPEGTFDGMVRHNVNAIVTALKQGTL